MTDAALAKQSGFTLEQIHAARNARGIRPFGTEPRKCLACGKMFVPRARREFVCPSRVAGKRSPCYTKYRYRLHPPKVRSLTARLRYDVLARDGFRCRYCGATPGEAELHVDHIVPVSRGGTGNIENLVTSCVSCNEGKNDRYALPPPPLPRKAPRKRQDALQAPQATLPIPD